LHIVVSFSGDPGGLSVDALPAHLLTSTCRQGKFCLNLANASHYAGVVFLAYFANLRERQAALAQFVKYVPPAF
jgi:hypothetical protein